MRLDMGDVNETYHIILDPIDAWIHLPDPRCIPRRRIPLNLIMPQAIHPQNPHLLERPLSNLARELAIRRLFPLSPWPFNTRPKPLVPEHLPTP